MTGVKISPMISVTTQRPEFPTAVTTKIAVMISGRERMASMNRLVTSSTTPRR